VWGLGIGLLGALAASQFLAMVVFGASPRDPFTLGIVSVLLAAVALVACWLPARRAARVDPLQAMMSN
jgi:ABC-type antimicrobial peptide transport system permease subunit